MGLVPRCFRAPFWIVILLSALQVGATAQATQKAASPPRLPLWGKLLTRIDSARLKVGDAVLVRTDRFWGHGTCNVPAGTTLQGSVTALKPRSAASKTTQVSLRFSVPCYDGPTVPIVLIAALYPLAEDMDQIELTKAMPMGIGAGATGRQSTNLDTLPTPFEKGAAGKPPEVKVGQVTGIRHLSLAVPGGAPEDTVLQSTDKALRLEPGTRLAFLLPVSGK